MRILFNFHVHCALFVLLSFFSFEEPAVQKMSAFLEKIFIFKIKEKYMKLLHIFNVVGWWTKFTKGRKPKAEENTDQEVDAGKKSPLLELTEDEYEAFHSKFPLPWWCIIIAYVLSILSILW